MTQLLAKPKNRTPSKSTTNLIPIGRISPNDLYDRMVPRKVFLDPCLFPTESSTPTLPIPGMSEMSKGRAPDMPSMHTVFGSGCSHVAVVKKAQEELLSVNRAALQVFIAFAQSGDAHLGSSSTFAADMIGIGDAGLCLFQANTGEDDMNGEAAAFDEPLTFGWTKKAHQIRQAAKRYSEQTHADY